MTTPSVALVVSTSGDWPSTVTCSSSWPTCSCISARTVSLTTTVIVSRMVVRNPVSVAFT